jgi:hypothetical protein
MNILWKANYRSGTSVVYGSILRLHSRWTLRMAQLSAPIEYSNTTIAIPEVRAIMKWLFVGVSLREFEVIFLVEYEKTE